MAPLLFLFLIQACNESLEKQERPESATEKEYRFHRTTDSNRGRLRQQPNRARTKGTAFNFDKSLFVDDAAYLYGSCDETLDNAERLRAHYLRFGLKVHVGDCDAEGKHLTGSKTEALFVPASPMTTEELAAAKADLIFGPNKEFYIPFTDCFKYLGARITESINDETEIAHRLTQATNQAAALQNFWRSPTDVRTKRQILLAIPLNTALYGCESWTLTAHLRDRITGFFHKAGRRFLHVNMHHVEQYHIRNEHVRNCLCIPDPLDIIRRRQFNQLGKFARMPDHRLPRRLLTAWIQSSRQIGRPRMTLRDSYVETLQHIIGDDVPNDGALSSWIPLAQSRSNWEDMSQDWIERRTARTMIEHGRHPMLGAGICEHKYAMHFESILRETDMTNTDQGL